MTDMQFMTNHLDKRRPIPAVAELFRSRIEAESYGEVSAQGTLENVACNTEFLRDPALHSGEPPEENS